MLEGVDELNGLVEVSFEDDFFEKLYFLWKGTKASLNINTYYLGLELQVDQCFNVLLLLQIVLDYRMTY